MARKSQNSFVDVLNYVAMTASMMTVIERMFNPPRASEVIRPETAQTAQTAQVRKVRKVRKVRQSAKSA